MCERSHMTETVDSFIHEYARRYTAHDADGVTSHLGDRDAVRDHFTKMMDAYRGAGAATWSPIEIDTRQLGEHAAFATVRWNALDADGKVLRDTVTTYHLLADPAGWRLLSYTNHF